MPTIDRLDQSVYNAYAVRTQMIEQINQQYHLDEAGSIPPQMVSVDNYPRLTELDLLFGILPQNNSWALFHPPKAFNKMRRSPFSFSRVVPTLGKFQDSEEEEQQQERELEAIECDTPEKMKEKATIKKCFQQIKEINGWLKHIIGRIGQFLQG